MPRIKSVNVRALPIHTGQDPDSLVHSEAKHLAALRGQQAAGIDAPIGVSQTLTGGQTAYWFNTISFESRAVTVVKVLKNRIVVRTEDGHTYSPLPSMVSAQPVKL